MICRRASPKLSFHTLLSSTSAQLQLVQRVLPDSADSAKLLDTPLESVVWVRGIVKEKFVAKKKKVTAAAVEELAASGPVEIEIDVHEWRLLNAARSELPFKPNDHPDFLVRSSTLLSASGQTFGLSQT